MTKHHLLVNCPVSGRNKDIWPKRFIPHYIEDVADQSALLSDVGEHIMAMVTDGPRNVDKDYLDALPSLKLIICLGVGIDKIDAAEAGRRGIAITNGSGTNAASVADHVFALMLAVARQILPNDQSMRQHGADEECPKVTTRTIYGKKLGILGLGAIGMEVAKRAQAFDMEVFYHNRSPRGDVDHTYCGSAADLAGEVEFLSLSCPGGAETHHLVNTGVLSELGPDGVLINVARGSIVDTDALVDALQKGVIRGAGLDVVGGDDTTRQPLCDMTNIVMTPHLSGNTQEAWDLKNDLANRILSAFVDGEKLPNQVI